MGEFLKIAQADDGRDAVKRLSCAVNADDCHLCCRLALSNEQWLLLPFRVVHMWVLSTVVRYAVVLGSLFLLPRDRHRKSRVCGNPESLQPRVVRFAQTPPHFEKPLSCSGAASWA